MKKGYVTARLFRNHRSADGLNTNELDYSDQDQSTEPQNNAQEKNEANESDQDQTASTLSQGLLNILQRALEVLAPNRKD